MGTAVVVPICASRTLAPWGTCRMAPARPLRQGSYLKALVMAIPAKSATSPARTAAAAVAAHSQKMTRMRDRNLVTKPCATQRRRLIFQRPKVSFSSLSGMPTFAVGSVTG